MLQDVVQRAQEVCSKAQLYCRLKFVPQQELERCAQDLQGVLDSILGTAGAAQGQEQLIGLACAALELSSLSLDAALALQDQVSRLENLLQTSQHDAEQLYLRELAVQCENKLFRLCIRAPAGRTVTAKDVVHCSFKRLQKDKNLVSAQLSSFTSQCPLLEDGLEVLKGFGLPVAHPQQWIGTQRKVQLADLEALVEKHLANHMAKADVLDVLKCLSLATAALEEDVFVPTYYTDRQ